MGVKVRKVVDSGSLDGGRASDNARGVGSILQGQGGRGAQERRVEDLGGSTQQDTVNARAGFPGVKGMRL